MNTTANSSSKISVYPVDYAFIFKCIYLYLNPSPFTDMNPPQTIETVWVGFRIARRQYCPATFSQITTAGN